MKTSAKPLAMVLALLAFGCAIGTGQIVVQQDFSSGGTLASYFASTSPTAAQLIGYTLTAADTEGFQELPPDYTIFDETQGAASAALAGGAIEFSLLNSYRYYYRADLGHNGYQSFASAGSVIVRNSLGGFPVATQAFLQFMLHVSSTNTLESGTPGNVNVSMGQPVLTLIHTGGTGLRLPGPTFGTTAASGMVRVTLAVNGSTSPVAYTGPNGLAETLAGDTYDAWLNQTKVHDDAEFYAASIGGGGISLSSGLARNPDAPVSPTVGEPTIFRLDDFLLRRDLPPPPPLDTDNDGFPDFMETYFGTSPTVAGGTPLTVSLAAGNIVLGWPQAVPAGTTVVPQWSPDLSTWLVSGETRNGIPARVITVTTPAAGQKRASLPSTGLPAAHLRLKISNP